MERATINGIGIAYEVTGPEDGQLFALTPGGRFTMDVPGLREMAKLLNDAGKRVIIYDRPNCGYSDSTLEGETESETQAEALAGLIRHVGGGRQAVIAGGSGGSRVSMLAAARHPNLCSHLGLWWISGDPIGLMSLGSYYCGEAATLASKGGMDAAVEATSWAEHFAKNPAAKEKMRAMDPDRFIAVMQKWCAAYVFSDITPVPGMKPVDFARLTMPTVVFKSHKSDLAHTETTSLWVHRMIPHSKLVIPPWRDDEWNYQSTETAKGEQHSLFVSWPKLVPTLLELATQ
ncbi:MAG: alpha/beta fold hydrolase [Novosphingobium sp.]